MNLEKSQEFSRKVVSLLKAIRLERGLSQEKLAKKAGVSRGAVSHIEKGIRNPTLFVCHALASAMETSLGSLVINAENDEPLARTK